MATADWLLNRCNHSRVKHNPSTATFPLVAAQGLCFTLEMIASSDSKGGGAVHWTHCLEGIGPIYYVRVKVCAVRNELSKYFGLEPQ